MTVGAGWDARRLFAANSTAIGKKSNGADRPSPADHRPQGVMQSILYDLSPGSFDLGSPAVKRRIGKDLAAYLAQMQKKIQEEFSTLERSPEFSIGVEYKLVLTEKPGDADIVLSTGDMGESDRKSVV